MFLTSDYIRNFGNTYLSPWISGEQITRTASIMHEMFQKLENISSELDIEGLNISWSEPPIFKPTRSVNTSVFQNRNGGNSFIINDDDSTGTILIAHNSGAVVQIDAQGTVFIKSMADTYNTTEGVHHSKSEGDHDLIVGGNYNIRVESGTNKIWVAGDMDIECENFNVTARGKASINAAEGVQMRGGTISMEAHSDNIDIYSFNQTRIGAGAAMSLHSVGNLNLQADAAANIKSGLKLIANGSEVQIKGSTVYIDDVVRMAEGGAGDAANATDPSVPEMKDPPASSMSTAGEGSQASKRVRRSPTALPPLADDGKEGPF